MTSLRNRIAILLIVSIVGVVGLATAAALSVMRGPPPEATMVPVARQIRLMSNLVPGAVDDSAQVRPELRDAPATGLAEPGHTRILSSALRRIGMDYPVRVTRRESSREPPLERDTDTETGQRGLGMIASVGLPDGRWMMVDIPDFAPPRSTLLVLAGWMGLILLGATVISLYFASVLARPLRMLETAVQRVGPDGVLAPLPEDGTGEVRATARALNMLSGRLKSAMESRMRLVAAAGHDLRTPMTRMRLRAEFLPDEEREKWLNDLEELDRIADSAIRLVREEVEQDDREPIALDALVKELAADMKALGLPVIVGKTDPAFVRAGALGLRRALRNLVTNAATHGKGCVVELLADSRSARIVVTDNGPGIPPDLIDRAFEPFFRVDPARRKSVPGAGLGLAIAREIIERYGGSLALANHPQGGLVQTATFWRESDAAPLITQ